MGWSPEDKGLTNHYLASQDIYSKYEFNSKLEYICSLIEL